MLAPYKGFYTQEQMRELVKYAATYHVEIVPEIEMPGHEVAAISVFPELTCHQRQVPVRTTCGVSNELLCPGNDFTYEFLGNVFKARSVRRRSESSASRRRTVRRTGSCRATSSTASSSFFATPITRLRCSGMSLTSRRYSRAA